MTSSHRARSAIIFILFFLMYVAIAINLYIVQIRQHDFYKNLGSQQYSMSLSIPVFRGAIFDRNGSYLAMNREGISAFILPKQIADRKALEAFLKEHFPSAYERLITTDKYFIYVKRALSNEEKACIEAAHLQDIKLLKEPGRYYPVPAAGPVVGMTGIDNTGLFGIELLKEGLLAGKTGTALLQKDARSGHFYFKKDAATDGCNGSDVAVTLDADLQFMVHNIVKEMVDSLHADGGAALVLDPQRGDILAMANYPSIDPNAGKSFSLELTSNRCIVDVHEPGSVVKPLVAMALLEEGLATPEELFDCENTLATTIDGIPVRTVKAHGMLTLSEVIQKSNNIGIVKAARRLGPKLYDHYRRFGFGAKTGLHWPGEQAGFVNHPSKWSGYSLRSLAFGYEITASLLQVARAFCLIANDGYSVEPRLFIDEPIVQSDEPLYSARTIEAGKLMLEKTVKAGTAWRARMRGYRVMGKTGTTNKLVNGVYDSSQNMYIFAGIIEKDTYRRVIVTMINNVHREKVYASQTAVPLFEKVAQALVIHERV